MQNNDRRKNLLLIYVSTKPLTKTFGAVPTRLDKPPIVAEYAVARRKAMKICVRLRF
jgi:hypothetical protein